jgi:hypothetical protein
MAQENGLPETSVVGYGKPACMEGMKGMRATIMLLAFGRLNEIVTATVNCCPAAILVGAVTLVI